ncbi:hypothetical protein B0T20DRAFT_356857 [Sordaria brevicollis]|uniref:Uncharacterized protein n=1 Tax=Sordaria brevicollis TaxID=83679 RepID=A0AAE0UAV2_SORBR|nr:hypothetical protein B0T20DRAFT_356857 [Sordaria brevicollis]
MATPSPLRTSQISDDLLRTIYASDQEMYPAPLTYERLRSWRDACPELSICFTANDDHDSSEPVGVIIVLPLLKKYWEDLLVGKIKEVDVDAKEMFVRGDRELQAPAEVGLHVFHIERFAAWDAEDALKKTGARPAAVTVRGCEDGGGKTGFADLALEEVRRRVEAANAEAENNWRRWDVLGFSALTATPAGKKTFARLGFVPTGYKEIFQLVDTRSPSTPENMTVATHYVYPGQTQIGELSSGVISESEMTVRYCPASR